ncbi:MAG: hypothetical protein MJ107_02805 [Lachnospiraceae bacterium]|nr:hypothetical protein [Lachnospiraceae bacterium]
MSAKNYDSKLIALLIIKNIKFIILGVIIGALLIGVPYSLSKTVIGNFDYRSEVTAHVEFGEDSAGNMYQYINYFSWSQWITSDKYMDVLEPVLSGLDREEIRKSLNAEIRSDERIATFSITTHNPDTTNRISDAVASTFAEFAKTIPEVKDAEVITHTPAVKYFVFKKIPEVFVFGAILGFATALFWVWLWVLFDDSVYIPELFEKDRNIVVNESSKACDGEIIINKEPIVINPDIKSVCLAVSCGKRNGKLIGNVLHQCNKYGVKIDSVRLIDKNEKLIKAYYADSSISHLFMKRL